MKKIFLLPVLLSVISGCASYNTLSGTGGGDATASTTDSNIHAQPKISSDSTLKNTSQPFKLPTLKSAALKSQDLEKIDPPLRQASLKRYTTYSNKNMRSDASTRNADNRNHYPISAEKTSRDETDDIPDITAPHKHLSTSSSVKATNLKNRHSVNLHLNDKGSFYVDRVTDSTYATAQKRDIHKPATERVKIEALPTQNKEKVYLQLGVFSNPDNARKLQQKLLENKIPQPTVKPIIMQGKEVYRVQLGPLLSIAKVNEINKKLAAIGISETWHITENKL